MTMVLEMPNPASPYKTVAHVEQERGLKKAESVVDLGIHGPPGETNLDRMAAILNAIARPW